MATAYSILYPCYLMVMKRGPLNSEQGPVFKCATTRTDICHVQMPVIQCCSLHHSRKHPQLVLQIHPGLQPGILSDVIGISVKSHYPPMYGKGNLAYKTLNTTYDRAQRGEMHMNKTTQKLNYIR
jgi:hypothetical protein